MKAKQTNKTSCLIKPLIKFTVTSESQKSSPQKTTEIIAEYPTTTTYFLKCTRHISKNINKMKESFKTQKGILSHTTGKISSLKNCKRVFLLDCFLPGFTGCTLPVLKAMPHLEHNDKKQRSRCGVTALLAEIVLNESCLSDGVVPSQLTHLHPDQTLCIVRKLEEEASCLTAPRTEENIFKNSSGKSSQVSCS